LLITHKLHGILTSHEDIMTNSTPNLLLPYLFAAQAQKHVTHNEALQILDTVIQLTLQSISLTTAPVSSSEGQCWYVPAAATGAWEGQTGRLAIWQDGVWSFITIAKGWRAWVEDEAQFKVWDGSVWAGISGGIDNPSQLGINSNADIINRLSLNSEASLFNHDGAGHQLKINKQTAADTGSLLFQTDFSGRAEIGLTGDDDLHFKVTKDGDNWHDALDIDGASGRVAFPSSENDQILNMLKFGDYSASNNNNWYRLCEWETGGNFNTTTAILDVSHRSSFTFNTLKIRFEKRTSGFASCEIRAEGDDLQDGEEYLLVATNADAKVTLYHKRISGHFTERYMSVRHMWKVNNFTQFGFSEARIGSNEPNGEIISRAVGVV